MPREITNQIPANKLKTEKIIETLLAFVNKFAINKLVPITKSTEGTNTFPKFNISNRVKTNKIVPVRNRTELKTIPVLYFLRYDE